MRTAAAQTAPSSQPASGPDDELADQTDPRRDRSRRAAGPLVTATAAGLLLVLLALSAWTIHWGQRLRRRARPKRRGARATRVDPWVASGERLNQDDTEEHGEPR